MRHGIFEVKAFVFPGLGVWSPVEDGPFDDGPRAERFRANLL